MSSIVLFVLIVFMVGAISFAGWWFYGTLVSYLGEKGAFFGTIKEGQIKVARRGGINVLFFGKVKNQVINEETGEVTDLAPGTIPRIGGYFERKFGVRWIGFYPWNSIYHYRFRWNKWARPPQKTDYEIIPKDEIVDSVYFRAPYALVLKGLETSERLELTVEIVFTPKMINVNTALFLTSDWLANTSAQVTAAARDFFGLRDYNDLVKMQNEINSKAVSGTVSDFVEAMKSLNNKGFGNDPLPVKFGVMIDDISLLSIEIGEPKGDLARATHKKYVAERDAEVVGVAADAEAGRVRKIAEAKAAEIKAVGIETAAALKRAHKALGQDGSQIGAVKLAEAIAEAKTQTVMLGGNASPIVGVNNSKGGGTP
jgi:regulator of protease activity HflC (stomatin/prohibitin superfamily)